MGDDGDALQRAFQERVRRHMRVIPMAAVAFGLPVLLGGISYSVYGRGRSPAWVGVVIASVFALGTLATVALGLWSAVKNLRCPQCERSAWRLVSYNASVFSLGAPMTACRGCGAEIVGPDLRSAMIRMVLVGFAIGAAVGVAVVILTQVARP